MVFFLYNYFNPAFKAGGPIVSLQNLAEGLSKEIGIGIICSNKDHDGTSLKVPVNNWTCISTYKVFYSGKGFQGVRKAIQISNAHVYFINGMYSFQYTFLPALLLKGRKIISVRGMLHPEGLVQKTVKKKLYLFFWKVLQLHRTCEYHATSEAEKVYIRKAFGSKTRVSVIPNLPNIFSYQQIPDKEKNKLRLCTVSLISPMKNHLLVLKSLANCAAEITYDIYGPVKDNIYWEKCLAVIAKLPSNIAVNYHGVIEPGSIPQVIASAHVFIQPSESENFGHSLLEALTTGRPIITSNNTPWNFLRDNCAGINVSLEVSEVKSAIDLYSEMNHQDLQQWSMKAREFALRSLNIENIKRKYFELFQNHSN